MDFIELLQFSMGIEEKVPDADNVNWEAMLATAKKQSLAGVIYYGIGNLPKEQRPEKKLLLKWYMLAEKLGVRIEFIPVTDSYELDMDAWHELLKSTSPKLVSLTPVVIPFSTAQSTGL